MRLAYCGGNRLLDALSARELGDITRSIEVIDLPAATVTHAPDMMYDWVVFPIDLVLSVVVRMGGGETAEVGTIGNEGASGVEIAFGAPVLRTTICQLAGKAARMPSVAFLDAIDRNPGLKCLIRSTEKARMFYIEQMIACNAKHGLQQRCARWLLLVADRAAREDYKITHDFLSVLLGVRRASVSDAAKHLQDARTIAYSRGRVRIVDRPKLESVACECYKATASVFDAALENWNRPLTTPKRSTGARNG